MNASNQGNAKAILLSPISPVTSPETLNALENAERLVKNAQRQMMEVSLDSALNDLEDNSASFLEQCPLDDSLLYLHEIVESKFQESNNPNGICRRKPWTSHLSGSKRELQQDKFPVRESTGVIYKPLETSAQNSEFSTNQIPYKSYLKKESDQLKIELEKHSNVFSTTTLNDTKFTNKNSCATRRCTMTNTGVIEINDRDQPNGAFQIQTGPTLDIRRGLTVQTIESVHISPDPSSVPLYNNVATYCFRHKPSTSSNFDDSNCNRLDKGGTAIAKARNIYDPSKERQIRSTDYNDAENLMSTSDEAGIAVAKGSNNPTRDIEQVENDTYAMPVNRSDGNKNNDNDVGNSIRKKSDSNSAKSDTNVTQGLNLGESSMDDEKLHEREISCEVENGAGGRARMKKSVGINLTPVRNSFCQYSSIVDSEGESRDEKMASEGEDPPQDLNEEFASSLVDKKCYHVRSDKNCVLRMQAPGERCKTGSCSTKCERDVEYREKQKLPEALEAITNIEKIRSDIRDSGVVPAECTQIREGKNQCHAEVVNSVFESLSDLNPFKIALENFCKLGQKTRVSTGDNANPDTLQDAIDTFVKTLFDANSQSNSAHRLHSSVLNTEIEDSQPRQNEKSKKNNGLAEKTTIERKNDESTKDPKQVQLVVKQRQVEHRQGASTTVKSKIDNSDVKKLSTTARTTGELSTTRQFRTGQREKSDQYSKPAVTFGIPENMVDQVGGVLSFKEKEDEEEETNSLKDLDLTQPCVSDVDEVLKTYRESMSAICQSTEKLSQLISHHITKNTLSNLNKISPPSSLRCNPVENKKIPVESTLNSISRTSKKNPGQTRSDQRQPAAEETQRQLRLGSIPKSNECPIRQRNDSKLGDESSSPTRGGSLKECAQIFSSDKEKSNTEQFAILNDNNNLKSNSTATTKTYHQTPANTRPQSLLARRKATENQFMDVQYCMTKQSAGIPMRIGVASNQINNSQSKSSLNSPLYTYLKFENSCSKNRRLRRHSDYDIHNDQTADLDVYNMPLLISGFKDDASNDDRNNKMRVENGIQQMKEIELQVFGKIIDAMKNSSQFMKWFVVSLFNGIEIDSVNDIVRNLEDAAVHPIIIEQFLVILRERYRERSSLGESLMTTSTVPAFDDLQKEKDHGMKADLTKINEDLDNLKKSIDLNNGLKANNIHVNIEAEISSALHPIDDRIATNNLEMEEPDTNSKLTLTEDYAPSIDCSDSQDDRTVENKLRSDLVQSNLIPDKNVRKEDFTNEQDSLAVPRQNIENISHKSETFSKFPLGNSRTSGSVSGELSTESSKKAERVEQEAKKTSAEAEIHQNNDSTLKEQNNFHEKSKNSMLINTNSNKNCSSSSTDKDISFMLPCDNEMTEKFVDLINEEKSVLVGLTNDATARPIGFQLESSFRNSSQINSPAQENNTKMYCNSNSERSSIAIGKNDGKLNIPDDSALTNLTKNLRNNDGNIKCYCEAFGDDKTPRIESRPAPCPSSSDGVDALVNSRILSKYNQHRTIDLNEKSIRRTPDRTTLLSRGTIDKRSRPSDLTSTSKSHARNVADSSKSGNKGKKQLNKIDRGDKERSEENKSCPIKCTRSRESSDSEKSDGCQLCIKLRGKCSCLNCPNCLTKSRVRKEVEGKNSMGREKLPKREVPLRQFSSPKRSGQNTGKYFSSREPRSNSLETTKNVKICAQGIQKINEKSVYMREEKNPSLTKRKTKLKPAVFSGNNNGGLVKNMTKPKKKKISQGEADSHYSVNLRMKDKSQNTVKSLTACTNTETEDITNSEEVTVSTKLEKNVSEKITITDETSMQLSSEKCDNAEEIKCGANTSVTQESIDHSKNNCCGKIDHISKRITRSSGTENFASMESQTPKMSLNPPKNDPNNALESIPEIEISTESKIAFHYPKIDEESIIVLRPLNEADHTFFIAKPNCAEKRIIEEKLNRNVKIKGNKVTEQNCAFVRQLSKRIETAGRKVTHSNCGIHNEHFDSIDKATSKSIVKLNRATSANNCVENQICQVDCVGGRESINAVSNKQSNVVFASMFGTGSDVSVFEEKVVCTEFCTNDGECSRMYPQSRRESDYWEFPCKQDCPNKEICMTLCAPKPQLEQSVQTNSVDINEILERFTAENNVPNLKMPIVKAILQELKKFEDILKSSKEKLGTIPEKSESQIRRDNTEMENERELVEGHELRCKAEVARRKSIHYEEPQEKLSHIMRNRKSLILPNVVRGIADMHPSTTLERLKIRSADPLVSGHFNKPESDKRYAVFNQADPASSAIDLNDPRVQEHLASVAQIVVSHHGEQDQSNDLKNNDRDYATKVVKKMPTSRNSNDKSSSKLNKSRRGMDADFGPQNGQYGGPIEHNNSMKSFESSDLEPGEFLEVRTPFDEPSKSCQSSRRYDTMLNDQLSKEKIQCDSFCNDNKSYFDTKSCSMNVLETTKTQCNVDGSKSTNQPLAHDLEFNDNLKANNSSNISNPNVNSKTEHVSDSKDMKSRTMDLHTSTKDLAKSSKVNNDRNLNIAHRANERVNENPEIEQPLEHSDLRRPDDTINCCDRPQIIDYFLGKTKLEQIQVNYTKNQSDAILDDFTHNPRDNCRQLYMKFDFTSKTTSELYNSNTVMRSQDISSAANNNALQLFTPKRSDETILVDSNRKRSRHWEQTSSDTHSDGEINLPSSCSYSLGEVKISTAGITAGKSFEDPDGLTVYVTKSILDSTLVTGTSPGEILAEINKAESDFSTSSS